MERSPVAKGRAGATEIISDVFSTFRTINIYKKLKYSRNSYKQLKNLYENTFIYLFGHEMKRFTAIKILVIFAILGISTALFLQVIPEQEQNPADMPSLHPPTSGVSGTPITLQEARAKAPFLLVPTYLTEGFPLRRVTGDRGLVSLLWENDDFYGSEYGEISLLYSDRPITTSLVNKYPAGPKLAVGVNIVIGEIPDENWVRDSVAYWNQQEGSAGKDVFEVVEVRGTVGIGRDLGHVNKFDGYEEPLGASLTWWENNLRFGIGGMLSLKELLKIAESLEPLETS